MNIKLIQDTYLQIYNTCMTTLHSYVQYYLYLYLNVTSTLQPVYFHNFICIHFIIPLFSIITKL